MLWEIARHSDDELVGWGVPPEWLEQVRAATEDDVLEVASHLPAEASEARLELAVGGPPRPTPVPEIGPTRSPIPTRSAGSGSSTASRSWSARSISRGQTPRATHGQDRHDTRPRCSLIVSIHAPDVNVDLYTEIANQVGIEIRNQELRGPVKGPGPSARGRLPTVSRFG